MCQNFSGARNPLQWGCTRSECSGATFHPRNLSLIDGRYLHGEQTNRKFNSPAIWNFGVANGGLHISRNPRREILSERGGPGAFLRGKYYFAFRNCANLLFFDTLVFQRILPFRYHHLDALEAFSIRVERNDRKRALDRIRSARRARCRVPSAE